jgi:hypothetical protein
MSESTKINMLTKNHEESVAKLKIGNKTTPVYVFYNYTGCPGRNVPDFGRMFLKLKYTDLTKNTYIGS